MRWEKPQTTTIGASLVVSVVIDWPGKCSYNALSQADLLASQNVLLTVINTHNVMRENSLTATIFINVRIPIDTRNTGAPYPASPLLNVNQTPNCT